MPVTELICNDYTVTPSSMASFLLYVPVVDVTCTTTVQDSTIQQRSTVLPLLTGAQR